MDDVRRVFEASFPFKLTYRERHRRMAPPNLLLRDTTPHDQGGGQGTSRGLLRSAVEAITGSGEGRVFKHAATPGKRLCDLILLNEGFLG